MIRMSINTEVRPADAEGIARAAELLRQGELVVLPTETVYGIAADARNGEAVSKIFVAKGRPQDNPLIVHVTGPEMLHGLVSEVPERAQLLMAAFCPGPLTIIMPRGPEVAAECCAGLDTVGIRMPTVSRPAQHSAATSGPRGMMMVSGPGQNAAISSWARSGTSLTRPCSISGPVTWTMRGLSCGRPFATKILLTASPLRASAAMP